MRAGKKKRASSPKAKLRANVAFRMNILFLSIFFLFSLLILRLGFLQIVQGEEFVRKLARTEEVPVNTSVPRGRIYDSFGRLMVDNEPQNAITYTKLQTTKQSEMLDIAKKLSILIDKRVTDITLRDKQDYWILLHTKEAYEKVSTAEKNEIINDESLSSTEQQRKLDTLVRERITEEELASFTPNELEVLAIYRQMLAGYALTPQVIKTKDPNPRADEPNDEVTAEEFARVSERLTDLPGVNTTTDWNRVPTSNLSILGRVTSPEQGLPSGKVDYFLSRDYSRNDRVGRSYIEQQYEEVLQGQKSVIKNITDGKGTVTETKTIYEGVPGKDLVLSIDSEFQTYMEEFISDKLLEVKKQPNSKDFNSAFFVAMDPYTGEVLSMVGKQLGKDKDGKTVVLDYAYGAFTAAYEVGSTVKPATLLTGYHEGAINIGDVLIDEPVNIAGTIKSSIFNRSSKVAVSDLKALERSSNVYMFKTGIRLANANYRYGESMYVSPASFTLLRNSYAQFGLGIKTGIDLPNEASGSKGPAVLPGKYLDLTIGQFDTYTTMQLAQYVSTLANGGTRIKPHVVKEIREPSLDGKTMGPLLTEIGPTVLNKISNSTREINRVREGMLLAYTGSQGTATSWFRGIKYTAAGKTGTAEAPGNKINLTHIGFAPYEKPEIAYAIIVPTVPFNNNGPFSHANNDIARAATDKFFEIKKSHANAEVANQTADIQIQPAYEKSVPTVDEEENATEDNTGTAE
ncbi:peptidoglycan D,D-transpeptidase FtsI family protein [Paenisporosarcina cavernae]|uniref:Penicillin-binding protein 2 n=1 Tax=Paenisporosarcina cavernae TaxID=2320858 RepID=A0A385YVI8_9BACL|nr:penicillin-binding protein 2 [Paenisporosarcina cavernae]AYC29582.1 penicillin-binding protein 2 [Paenisporosarcina cavernae]